MSALPCTVEPSPRPRLRILCVDDLPEIRHVLQMLLERQGYQVTCVDDGHPAHELIAANPDAYDLIITDHEMPIMTGLELVTCLRCLAYHGKVLVYSSSLDSSTAAAYRQLGVDGLMDKPLAPRALIARIEGLFDPHVAVTGNTQRISLKPLPGVSGS